MRVGERRMIGEAVEPAGGMSGGKLGEEQPAEQARERTHAEEESRPACDPTLAIERDSAARRDHMPRADDESLPSPKRAPSVQHRGAADAGAAMLGGRQRWAKAFLGCSAALHGASLDAFAEYLRNDSTKKCAAQSGHAG